MRRSRGFTLIELGVILAVIAVGMAYIAPDFVEMARGELATRAAKEMSNIANASKWYYLNEGGDPIDRADLRWPGEDPGVNCIQMAAGGPNSPQGQLTGRDYLETAAFTNPWGRPYNVTLQLAQAGAMESCKLIISTQVPNTVPAEIKTYLPMAACDSIDGAGACPGAAPGGFDTCCAKVVRPGEEAILQEWIASVNMCDVMMGGEIDPATGKCDVRGDWAFTVCQNVKNASCPDGFVAVGNFRTSCGKYCEETWLKCCKGEMP